ncbi:hypothetical protein G7046_g2975 [Stylonectria norvegica]|nr:hypothetical protein G7046_g2975 [Stylonectria norvegica]
MRLKIGTYSTNDDYPVIFLAYHSDNVSIADPRASNSSKAVDLQKNAAYDHVPPTALINQQIASDLWVYWGEENSRFDKVQSAVEVMTTHTSNNVTGYGDGKYRKQHFLISKTLRQITTRPNSQIQASLAIMVANESDTPQGTSTQNPTTNMNQPWKEWIGQEISARKAAEESTDLKEIQNERRKQFEESSKNSAVNRNGPENKAG